MFKKGDKVKLRKITDVYHGIELGSQKNPYSISSEDKEYVIRNFYLEKNEIYLKGCLGAFNPVFFELSEKEKQPSQDKLSVLPDDFMEFWEKNKETLKIIATNLKRFVDFYKLK